MESSWSHHDTFVPFLIHKLYRSKNTVEKDFQTIKCQLDLSLIRVADLIRDYPEPGTAFLGLLLLIDSHQTNGFGKGAYLLLEKFAAEQLAARKMRLSYLCTNPVQDFWIKMGFVAAGEIKEIVGKSKESKLLLMEKNLHD